MYWSVSAQPFQIHPEPSSFPAATIQYIHAFVELTYFYTLFGWWEPNEKNTDIYLLNVTN